MRKKKGAGLEPWPARLTAAPPRLEEIGVSSDEFHEDTVSSATELSPNLAVLLCISRKNYFLVKKHFLFL